MIIHFIRPQWLLALIPTALYLLWVIYSFKNTNPWKNVCDPHLLPSLLQSKPTRSRIFSNTILFLFYIISIFALAGPALVKSQIPIYKNYSSLMLVLDLSSAMEVSDLKPDRLTRAKLKIRDLINSAETTQMGLVAFTAEAFVASPLSQDANTLKALLDDLDPQMMPVAGADIGQGLMLGLNLLKQAGVEHGHILLITASEPNAASWAAAKNIAQSGNHLTILAMLDANADNQATISHLQQLATMGDGYLHLFTADSTDIRNILTNKPANYIIKNEKPENAYLWQDAGPWLCLLLIPLALIVLRGKVQHEKSP